MAKFMGNVSDILDIDALLTQLGPGRHETMFLKDSNGKILDENKDDEFVKKIVDADYPEPYFSDQIYYAGFDFDQKYIRQLDKFLGTVCIRCFISQTAPGIIIPPHYDFPTEYRKLDIESLGVVEAYHIHLGAPSQGQILMVEGDALHMQESGNCYKWDDYLNCHSACNIGYETKYVLLYKGVKTVSTFDYTYEFSYDDDNVKIILEDGTKI